MKRVLVVNLFASNQYLSDILERNDIYSVGLYTVDFSNLYEYLKPADHLFTKQLFLPNAKIEHVFDHLQGESFDYVITGSEGYVNLSEQLAQYFTPMYANDPESSSWRDDKLKMHERLKRCGLSYIRQQIVNKDNYLSAIDDEFIFPLFIKPRNGIGSFGAQRILSLPELKSYFGKDKFGTNIIGSTVTEFILSEFVTGEEYLIDTFSVNGEHHIATIQKYNKQLINGFPKYISWEVEHDIDKLEKISHYVKNILNATNFKNGFAHIECFYTECNDVVLIEINPRISGAKGCMHLTANASGNLSQIDIMLSKIFDVHTPIIMNDKYVRVVLLYNGGYNLMPDLNKKGLLYSGVVYVAQNIQPGCFSHEIVTSLADAAGFVIVEAGTLEQLEERVSLIQDLDNLAWRAV